MNVYVTFGLTWVAIFSLIVGVVELRRWARRRADSIVEKLLWEQSGRRIEKETAAKEDAIWEGNKKLR